MKKDKNSTEDETGRVKIDTDILQKIKKEAKFKKQPYQKLLNTYLREKVFAKKDGPKKKEKKLEVCPQCKYDLLSLPPIKENLASPKQGLLRKLGLKK